MPVSGPILCEKATQLALHAQLHLNGVLKLHFKQAEAGFGVFVSAVE